MNATTSPQSWTPERPSGSPAQEAGPEACPLCGQPLAPTQDWCLRCGGAARTRLAASPRWSGPVIAVAVVAAIALAVLAVSLVKLAGGSSSSAKQLTRSSLGAPLTPTVRLGGASAPAATAPTGTIPTAPAGTAPATPAPPAGAHAGSGATSTTPQPTRTSPPARAPATSPTGG